MDFMHFISGPNVIEIISCSTQLSMKVFMFLNVKMPTIVGILTCMSRKHSILGFSELEKCWIPGYFHTNEHLKFHAQLSGAWNKFYILGPRSKLTSFYSPYVGVGVTLKSFTSKFFLNFQISITTGQKHFSLGRNPFVMRSSLGRKQEIKDSLVESQILQTVSAGSEN